MSNAKLKGDELSPERSKTISPSSLKVQCENCGKFFLETKLEAHQSKCVTKEKLQCYCDHTFSSKHTLNRHMKSCKAAKYFNELVDLQESFKKKEEHLKKEIDAIHSLSKLQEEEITELHIKVEKLNKQHKEDLIDVNQRHRDELAVLQKEHKKELIAQKLELESQINTLIDKHSVFQDHTKEKEKMFRDQIRILESRPQTVINSQITNNCNTQINQLLANIKPISNEELLYEINLLINGEDFLPDDEVGFARKMFYRCLKTQIIKSDSSRKVVLWKDEDERTIKDPKALALSSKIFTLSKQLFIDKKTVLENDRNSPTLEAEFRTTIDKWISMCNRIINNTDYSKNAFGKQLAVLTYDKETFMADIKEKDSLPSPLQSWFQNEFYKPNSFFMFIDGVRGFGVSLKEKYSDYWLLPYDTPDVMEFRMTRQEDYKPVPKSALSQAISSCFDEKTGLEQYITNCFAVYDETISIEDKEQLTRGEYMDNLTDTIQLLRNPDDECWDTIYNILLCIE